MNKLYYGDNLQVLREHLATNPLTSFISTRRSIPSATKISSSKRRPRWGERPRAGLGEPDGSGSRGRSPHQSSEDYSEAQIEAFEDTWHWNQQAEREFDELLHQPNTDVAEMMKALRGFLGENDMMAYLTMMANRLLRLHRVLKSTGSLYLHC
jgi:hypothetical protein